MSIVPSSHGEPLIRNDATMKYRRFGQTGWQVSALSFGCMRLGADMELNTKLVATAIENGINYFETTRGYCGGQCQQRTAPGLAGKTRGVIVSGKGSIDGNRTAYEFRKEMELQLAALGLSHFKFYQVGWFGWDRIGHLLKPGGVLEAIRQAQREGLVQRIGFTGHDKPENFVKCIETGLFDSVTVPYNMLDRSYEPVIRRAGELGMGVVAMCPVAGGVLAGPSEALREAVGLDLPTPAMALRFVLSNPDVSTACSGMNAMGQLEENLRTVAAFEPDAARFQAMCEGLDRLRSGLGAGICTGCRYCMECPRGVDIPWHLRIYNDWKGYGLESSVRPSLARIPARSSLRLCDRCGVCETKCPNRLPVRERLKELAAFLPGAASRISTTRRRSASS
jgi:predicted aldo/keto reductase-like oxidoreductase